MSRPDDMIMVTFTREELELIKVIFTEGDYASATETGRSGKPDTPLCNNIISVTYKALRDTE